MDREAMKEAMKTSISEVLETMFFLPLEVSEAEADSPLFQISPEKLKCTSLKFQGPYTGEAIFLIPNALAGSLTADFMGRDSNQVDGEDVDGTIKELLNMICGKTLSLFQAKSTFKLGIPEMVNPGEALDDFFSHKEQNIALLCDAIDDQLGVRIVIDS
jgi:CheY-specific phosphatase CheX